MGFIYMCITLHLQLNGAEVYVVSVRVCVTFTVLNVCWSTEKVEFQVGICVGTFPEVF